MTDPIEGAAYDRDCAMVLRGKGGRLYVSSFAHGGRRYEIVADASAATEIVTFETMMAMIAALPTSGEPGDLGEETWEVLRMVAAGDFGPAEVDAFAKAAKARIGLGVTAFKGQIKAYRKTVKRLALDQRRDWGQEVIRGDNDEPKTILFNAALAFRKDPEWAGVLAFNEFTGVITLCKAPPWEHGVEFKERPFEDADGRQATLWLQELGIHADSKIVFEAIAAVAEENRFHPVREYLDELVWDGTPRLDNWLETYMKVSPEEGLLEPDAGATAKDQKAYQKAVDGRKACVKAVGTRWMIGAVARIYEPGCQLKTALILGGDQDLLKSTALATLGDPWFTDQVPDLSSKDALLQLAGVWIIEFAELTSFHGKDAKTIKAFMTTRSDRYRAPYGRLVANHPRQCAFAATTNERNYLHDPTGGTRFWCVWCAAEADIERLKADRNQLWAEAVYRYRAGEKWYLHEADLRAVAKEITEDHYEDGPWDSIILDHLRNKTVTSTRAILRDCIDKRVQDRTKRDEMEVAKVLTHLRWVKKQCRSGTNRGKNFYYAPEGWKDREATGPEAKTPEVAGQEEDDEILLVEALAEAIRAEGRTDFDRAALVVSVETWRTEFVSRRQNKDDAMWMAWWRRKDLPGVAEYDGYAWFTRDDAIPC
jgi:predicted P-loop ATPase